MTRILTLLCLSLSLAACRRGPRAVHMVHINEAGGALMVTGVFGVAAPAALGGFSAGAGARAPRGQCVRVPGAARVGGGDPGAWREAAQAAQARFRDAGQLLVRDGRGETLAALRPVFNGMYAGAVARGSARRIEVEVTGGDGVPAHRFASMPLNPVGDPPRLVAPAQGFVARRLAPLRIAWAGAGFRDALLSVVFGSPGSPDAVVIGCRVDFGRGTLTLPARSVDAPGEVPALVALTTMTSSEEGAFTLHLSSGSAMVTGEMR